LYITFIIFELIVVLVDAEVHSEHVQVIGMDIGPESVEKCRDVENESISRKTVRVYP
jgi:hypothetical protein